MSDENKPTFREVLDHAQAKLEDMRGTPDQRSIKRLEKDMAELNALFIKTDQELRKKINDQRITTQAGVGAIELSLAHRLAVTLDVVMNMLPSAVKPAALNEIARRVAEIPPTDEIARRAAARKYREGEGGNY